MNDDQWREFVCIEPEAADARIRASRARTEALRRGDGLAPAQRALNWAGLALAASLFAGAAGLWLTGTPDSRLPSPAVQTVKQDRLEMHLTLSDGTLVHWVFDDRFGL
jgi:hypothetical protein